MTREQVQDFMAMIQAVYPNFKPKDKTAAINAWKLALEDYEEKAVHIAFKMYMKSNISGFAPTPGQIIDMIHKLTDAQELNEMEAWALVRKAIGNGQNAEEEFGKLPPLVQKAVGIPGQLMAWGLDEHFNENVVMSHFVNCYRTVLSREKEIKKMPAKIRKLIESVNRGSYAEQIEQKNQNIVAGAAERRMEQEGELENKREVAKPPDSYYELMERLRGEENEID